MDGLLVILGPLFRIADLVLNIYTWVIIAMAVMSWLVAFGVVNTRNRAVWTIGDLLTRLTEPLLRPIRRILPSFGGIDLSPVVLLLAIFFLREVLARFYVYVARSLI